MASVRHRSTGGRGASILVVIACLAAAVGVVVGGTAGRAEAAVTSVKGSACGYFVFVGLFGGPQSRRGCGQTIPPGDANSASPSVSLPSTGSASAITASDPDGARGVYGPATIFGGIWPDNVQTAPPSGPISVSTQGTPAGGTVTSSADITLLPTPTPVHCYGDPDGTTNCLAPGGFGPNPVWGDSLHVQCSANSSGVSGSATFTNSFIAHSTDSDGAPIPGATEAIPANPPANYTRSGVITNVGDVFTAVFNEQIINADGSLTVNAVHMYLFGPTAVGDVVKGQVTCGVTPNGVTNNETQPPFCGIPIALPVGPTNPTPKEPRQELVGVFDTSGLQSVSNIQVTHGTVQVGLLPNDDTNPDNDYLKFTVGQTGPLSMVATRDDPTQRMVWSFDVADMRGNTRHCTGVLAPYADALVDFDGNGSTDVAVYRPTTGQWFVHDGVTAVWGASGDIPVPGDYDGDGNTDITVYRPSTGQWFVRNGITTVWGVNDDVPVPADYDGNGSTDIAVYRPSTGQWFVRSGITAQWGAPGDIPVPGDYDGNGSIDIAVYRPSTGQWFVRNGPTAVWGASGDVPVPGDYDANGTYDIAVYRPSTGQWFVRNGATAQWGATGDVPVPGDYDGNGTVDIAVYRPATGQWFVRNGIMVVWGASGDVPLSIPSAVRRAYFP